MKYPIIPLILQIIALIILLVAISFDAYTLYVDGRWFHQVGGDNEHIYFIEIKRKFLMEWYSAPYDVNPQFKPHHRPRVFPVRGTFGNFLRYSKSEPFIFLAFLCVTAVVLIILIVLTCVRKRQFLPGPCRQNGTCYLILALVIIFATTAEIIHRIEVKDSYSDYKVFEKSPNSNTKIGAWMLGSCGRNKESYEALLGSRLIKERDDLHVCQFWYAFLAAVILALIGAVFLIIIFIFLCIFWARRSNIDKADEESIERDCKERDEGSRADENPCVDEDEATEGDENANEDEVNDGDNYDENANKASDKPSGMSAELSSVSSTASKGKGPKKSKSPQKSKSKSPKKKSPKRRSPKSKKSARSKSKSKSPKKKSPKKSSKKKSPKKKSPKKKSPKKKSPKKKSPKKKSPKAKPKSPKEKSPKKPKSPMKK